jgi:hypothetical protein
MSVLGTGSGSGVARCYRGCPCRTTVPPLSLASALASTLGSGSSVARCCRGGPYRPIVVPPLSLSAVAAGMTGAVQQRHPIRVSRQSFLAATGGARNDRAPRAHILWLVVVTRKVSKTLAAQTTLGQPAGCDLMRGREAIEALAVKICRDAFRRSTVRRLPGCCPITAACGRSWQDLTPAIHI